MVKINIHEAKTHLSRYAKRVKAGETLLLCDRNKPFAEIRPIKKAKKESRRQRRIGQDKGKGFLSTDWDSAKTNAAVGALFGVGQ